MTEATNPLAIANPKMSARDVKVFYGAKQAIKGVSQTMTVVSLGRIGLGW